MLVNYYSYNNYLGCLDISYQYICMQFSRYIKMRENFVLEVRIFVMTDVLSVSGDNEIRTRDLLLARQALSQLSYTPKGFI